MSHTVDTLPLRQGLARGWTPRHRHAGGYAAIVLRGGYLEAGDAGRRRVSAGEAILHDRFSAHANSIDGQDVQVLNLPLPGDLVAPAHFVKIGDIDALARAAETSLQGAVDHVLADLEPLPPPAADWPDLLAEALRSPSPIVLGDWARDHGLAPATVSRGFRQAFGVSPIRYQLEARGLAAWRALAGDAPLAALAADLGFADQAHMTRIVSALTGRSPGAWRRSNPFKIEDAAFA